MTKQYKIWLSIESNWQDESGNAIQESIEHIATLPTIADARALFRAIGMAYRCGRGVKRDLQFSQN